MGCSICIVKSCCCGKELGSGVFIWSMVAMGLHFLYLPLPMWLSEIVPYGTYVIPWIVLMMLSFVVLLIGAKGVRPAFLTLWLVFDAVNIVFLLLVWVFVVLGILFKEELGLVRKELADVKANPFWVMAVLYAAIILCYETVSQIYFWVVVFSLRRRMMMEIYVGFNAERQNIVHPSSSREETQIQKIHDTTLDEGHYQWMANARY